MVRVVLLLLFFSFSFSSPIPITVSSLLAHHEFCRPQLNFSEMNPENLLNLSTQKCTLGCPILDRVLSGGIPCNSITELVSESGCGKTQLCLQLLLSSQLPISNGGLNSSIYIHYEFPFPFRRLQQLSQSFRSSYPHCSQNPCDKIFVRGVQSAEELLGLLERIDTLITNPPSQNPPVKLLVIDSIANLFRSEFENTPGDLKRRSCLFFKISGVLRLKAKKYGLAVVVTNQVVDFVEGAGGRNGGGVRDLGVLSTSGRRVNPALGLAWSNCVNSRLFSLETATHLTFPKLTASKANR